MSDPLRVQARHTANRARAADRTLSLSFAAAALYVVVEYMRFQERYGIVAGVPFGQIAGILLIASCWIDQKRLPVATSTFKWILAFLGWLLLVSVLGANPGRSMEVWIDILKLGVMAIFTAAALDTRKRLYAYLIVMLLVYVLHTNFAFRGWVAAGFSVGFRGMWVGSGPLRNPNDFGAALAAFWGISLAMIWADRAGRVGRLPRSWFHIINTAFFAVAFITSSSRGAAFAFIAGILYTVARLRLLIKGIAALAAFIVIYAVTASPEQIERYTGMGSGDDQTANERIETWKTAIDVFRDHPVLGTGPGTFTLVAPRYSTSGIIFVQHNIFLQALTDAGVPGLLILLGILWSFFRDQRLLGEKLDLHAHDPPLLPWVAFGLNVSMISFMVAGLFITVLFYPFMWVLLGISMATRRLAEAEGITNQRHLLVRQRRSPPSIP